MQILNSVLNNLGLQIGDLLNSIITLLLIFTFALIGSYLHELYCLIRDKSDKIEINKIIITCVTATIILFLFSDKVILTMGYKGLMFVSFVSGSGGYKYVYKFYNGEILDIILRKNNIEIKDDKKENDNNE